MGRGFRVTVAVLFCTIFTITPSRGGGVPEILDERIAVELDPPSHLVTGVSTVTVGPHGGGRMEFALHPAATVLGVTIEGKGAPFDFSGGKLTVRIPPGMEEKGRRIAIAYRAGFNDPLPERVVTTEDPSYGVNGVIAPEGTFLGGGVGWYPRARGVPARRTIEVTAPAGMEAVTAGARLERREAAGKSVSVWKEDHPTPDPSLSAGPYRVGERKLGSLPLFTYFRADAAPLSSAYLDASARYIRFYEGLFGPYPFEKFAVVENFIPTGYGFPSYTLLGGSVIRLPFILTTSLPHEIAHNWWGNGVLVDYREGNWSEGLVTYVADYLLEEQKSPAAGRDYRFKLLTDYASLVPPAADFPVAAFLGRSDPASRAIGYGKGAMIFHMVRRLIGDEAFFAALRDLCRERLYREAAWSDFTRAFSRASGRDLAPLMKQWLERKGGPRLSLADVTSRPEGGKWVVSGKVVQASPPWSFPLDVNVETAAGDVRRTVAVDRESTPFTVTVAAPPRRLALDPESDLFRVLTPQEIPPAINRIKGSQRLLAVVAPGCAARTETLGLLLASLGHPGTRIVREDEAGTDITAGHDLLICGVPEKKGLLPPLPPEVKLSGKEFAIGRERFSSPEDALFVVAGHPTDPARVTAAVPAAFGRCRRCLRGEDHTLRHVWLPGVSGGTNRKKGLLPAAGGVGRWWGSGEHPGPLTTGAGQ